MTKVFVTVGTDHHPFSRLIEWLEGWSETRGHHITWLVQHGSSPPMARAHNFVSLPLLELQAAHRESEIVVGQVGPGTIADANAAGKRPLVVPRRPELGEVVDDHQAIYGQLMFEHSRVHLADDRETFGLILDSLVRDPQRALLSHDASGQATQAARRVRDVLVAAAEGADQPPGLVEVLRRVRRLGGTRTDRPAR